MAQRLLQGGGGRCPRDASFWSIPALPDLLERTSSTLEDLGCKCFPGSGRHLWQGPEVWGTRRPGSLVGLCRVRRCWGDTRGSSCAGLGRWTWCLGTQCLRGWQGSVSGQEGVAGSAGCPWTHKLFPPGNLALAALGDLGGFSGLLGFPVTHSPSHPYQQHPQLCHIHGANQHHIPLMSSWVPPSPSLGKRPSREPFHFPNQMRHKKQ